MNHFLPDWLKLFANGIEWCYPVILILFVSKLFLKGDGKREIANLLVTTNLLLLISSLIIITERVLELWDFYFHTNYEWFAFRTTYYSPTFYFTYFIIASSAILLLFFRRFRRSWTFSFLILVILKWFLIYYWYLQFAREYLPSSWEFYEEDFWWRRITYILVFIVSMILMYSILYSTNKLPFASALFRNKRREADVQ